MSLHPCKISTLTFIDEVYVVIVPFTAKACPLYSPPQGGALVCTPPKGTFQTCAVMCRTGTDYVFSPPLVYFCSPPSGNGITFRSSIFVQFYPGQTVPVSALNNFLFFLLSALDIFQRFINHL